MEAGVPQSMAELEELLGRESPESRRLAEDIRDNPICCIDYDPEIPGIVVTWRRYASRLQLRYVHEKLLGLIKVHGARKILGDDTSFSAIDRVDQAWILEDWLPRALKAGFRAAASKRPAGYFGRLTTEAIQSQLKPIRIQSFEDLASARDWLIRCEV